jgi:hypothetical protein
MAQPISTPQQMPGALRPARRLAPAIAVAGVALGVAILLGRAGAVVSLRDGHLLRDDCSRHRGLLLIRIKGIS